jgi:membrane protein
MVVSLGIFTLTFAAITEGCRTRLSTGAIFVWAHLSQPCCSLGQAAPNSTYGAAGALIVLMFWVYYSAQIFLFGAELTKAIDDARNPTASEER